MAKGSCGQGDPSAQLGGDEGPHPHRTGEWSVRAAAPAQGARRPQVPLWLGVDGSRQLIQSETLPLARLAPAGGGGTSS